MSTYTNTSYAFGTSDTAQTLTGSFADDSGGKKIDVSGYEQVYITLIYTTGTGETAASVTVKPLLNVDGTGWGEIQIGQDGTPSSGVVDTNLYDRTFTRTGGAGATTYTKTFALNGGFGKKTLLKIQGKENGVSSNNGTLKVLVGLYTQLSN